MKNKNVKDEKKEKKIGLTTKIFIALLLGAVFGTVSYTHLTLPTT